MKYMGSKNRYAKELLPIILKNRYEGQYYVEPFCGGCNMIDKVSGNRIASDSHFYLIELLKFAQTGGWLPDFVSETDYKAIRDNKQDYDPALVGFGCSYSGKWFGGFARNVSRANPDSEILNMTARNYCAESKRNLLKQHPNLKGIQFIHGDYKNLVIPAKSIIYCDPPYKGTTGYKQSFNHDVFWNWAREKYTEGHNVFVSEYNAPEDWVCVFEKTVNNSLTKDTGSKKGIEKLFTRIK